MNLSRHSIHRPIFTIMVTLIVIILGGIYGGIFGAIVAESFDQNSNSSFHFDEAMKDLESDAVNGDIEVIAWQEQNSLTWGTGTYGAEAD